MPPSEQSTPTPADLLASATSLHDQAQYLLDDEVSYATSLRDARRTLSGLLVLAVGVGVFRLELFRAPGEILVLPMWSAWTVRGLFSLAFVFVLFAAYFIYTERDITVELADDTAIDDPPRPKGSALSVLYLKEEVLNQFFAKSPIEVMRMRTEGLRLAYIRLKDRNRRVRRRTAKGVLWAIAALVLVAVAIVMYNVTGAFV